MSEAVSTPNNGGTPPNNTSAGTPTSTAPWHGITDETTSAYISQKGWTDTASVIKSYQNAEKIIGRDPNAMLAIPKEGDQAGYDALYAKLGRPADVKGYDLKAGADGLPIDESFANNMAQVFHKAGLSSAQAKALVEAHHAHMRSNIEQQVKDYELNVQADKSALQAEWRGGYERMFNAAQSAVTSLDLPAEAIDGIEEKLGYAATIKLFAAIGQKLGEDKFVGAEGKTTRFDGQLTPQEAAQQIAAMKSDKVTSSILMDSRHPAHKETKAKWQKLFGIAYPE